MFEKCFPTYVLYTFWKVDRQRHKTFIIYFNKVSKLKYFAKAISA